jgi:integral membrane protein
MAYVVGVVLLVLVLVAVPLRYLAGRPQMVHVVGPIHGWLYIVYIVTALDLARRRGWPLGRTLLVVLAGTVPFMTFVMEHRVMRDLDATGVPAAGHTPTA